MSVEPPDRRDEPRQRCPQCGTALSETARYCPTCGRPTDGRSGSSAPWIAGIVAFIAGLAIAFLVTAVGGVGTRTVTSTSTRAGGPKTGKTETKHVTTTAPPKTVSGPTKTVTAPRETVTKTASTVTETTTVTADSTTQP